MFFSPTCELRLKVNVVVDDTCLRVGAFEGTRMYIYNITHISRAEASFNTGQARVARLTRNLSLTSYSNCRKVYVVCRIALWGT